MRLFFYLSSQALSLAALLPDSQHVRLTESYAGSHTGCQADMLASAQARL